MHETILEKPEENLAMTKKSGQHNDMRMSTAELRPFLDRFDRYIERFHKDTPENQAVVDFKRLHSLEVLREAKVITSNLSLSARVTFLVHLAALYHDLGRFDQFSRYKTFLDARSLDHARLSVVVLRREGMLRELESKEKAIVHSTICLHNKRTLPQALNPKLAKLAGILRDADKLANIPAVLGHFEQGSPADVLLPVNLTFHPEEYTPEVLVNVESGQAVDYKDLRWVNDLKLAALGWANDLNFSYTCHEFLKRGYVEKIMSHLPQRSEFLELGNKIKERLKDGKG
jgi:HD superfamily phosphodiesterase